MNPRPPGGTPSYKPSAAPKGMVFTPFGLKTGIHFSHFGLELGMIFEGTSESMNEFVVSIPNE